MHPSGLAALLQEAGLVHHQDPAWVAELLDDVAAHVVAERVWVPSGGGQQPLHPVRGGLLGVLGQLPAVLAVDPAKQPAQEPGGPAADLRAGEPWTDPLAQPLELRRPSPPPRPARSASTRSVQQKARNLPQHEVRLQY